MRYMFALGLLEENQTVIDIGCGNGYGTNILSLAGNSVLGIDKDREAILDATNHYPTIFYLCGDVKYLWMHFDVGVCFEFIEHLSKENGKKFFKDISEKVDALIFSTPVDSKMGENPIHLSQWSLEDLSNSIKGSFERIEFYSQDYSTGLIGAANEYSGFIIGVARKGKGSQEKK